MRATHSPDTVEFLARVADERLAQDALWGEQNHEDLTGLAGDEERMEKAKRACDAYNANDCVSWRDILTEEFYEVLAETDPEKLKAELVQLAAVCGSWHEAIERRNR